MKLLDLLFLCRPVVLIPVWGFTIFGYLQGDTQSLTLTDKIYDLGVMMIFSLSVASVYVFNQLADLEVDRSNGGAPVLVKSSITRQEALVFALLLTALSIMVPYFLGNFNLMILSVIITIIGFLYCFKPTYFSGRPIADFFTNGVAYGVVMVLAGRVINGDQNGILKDMNSFISTIPYFLYMCAGSISSTLPDIPGDKEHGKMTTAVVLGKESAHILAVVLLFTAFLSAWVFDDIIIIICSCSAFPLYLLYVFKKSPIIMESTYKIGGALAMIVGAYNFPLFIPLGILTFFCTWAYFRIRFKVSYPSLVRIDDNT